MTPDEIRLQRARLRARDSQIIEALHFRAEAALALYEANGGPDDALDLETLETAKCLSIESPIGVDGTRHIFYRIVDETRMAWRNRERAKREKAEAAQSEKLESIPVPLL